MKGLNNTVRPPTITITSTTTTAATTTTTTTTRERSRLRPVDETHVFQIYVKNAW